MHFPDRNLQRLYERASATRWQADTALDWATLDLSRLATPVRCAMAELYSDVLYAESYGVLLIERMVELAPEGWLRAFACAHVADEWRHVQFFARLLEALGERQAHSEPLAQLFDELGAVRDHDELMVHAQVIELAAQAVFVANSKRSLSLMERGVRLPGRAALSSVLRSIVDLVGADESHHIAFGMRYLRARLSRCSAQRRAALADRATHSIALMYRAFALRRAVFARLSLLPEQALERAFQELQRRFACVGLHVDIPRGA